jgi:hypothetical protein
MFSELVPASLRSTVYAFDRCFGKSPVSTHLLATIVSWCLEMHVLSVVASFVFD